MSASTTSKRFNMQFSHLGSFLSLVAFLSIIAGMFRHEWILTMVGIILSVVIIYSISALFFLSVIHRRRFRSLSCRILNPSGVCGDSVTVTLDHAAHFFCLPALIIRYEFRIQTKDKRTLFCSLNPAFPKSSFKVADRGAYYRLTDGVVLSDTFGILSVSFPSLDQNDHARLLISPHKGEQIPEISLQSGGSTLRAELPRTKTDDLHEQRQYVPGDDPRKINWKLYGHSGTLFIREGAFEPPPHANIVVLVDTQADMTVFSREQALRAVDILCEQALTLIALYEERINGIGWTGSGTLHTGTPAELAQALAYPFMIPLSEFSPLPACPQECSVIILALPRQYEDSATSSLQQFLSTHKADVLFSHTTGSTQPQLRRAMKPDRPAR
ncbi:MAG: DUF58 domain-containing protein [Treponema sp.]|jgi:hypothetical protein|nr:DUF58 domain-containing protein [Treponema sp.]